MVSGYQHGVYGHWGLLGVVGVSWGFGAVRGSLGDWQEVYWSWQGVYILGARRL